MPRIEPLALPESTRAAYGALMASLRIDNAAATRLLDVHAWLAAWLAVRQRQGSGALVVGICGAPGTGKTTLSRGLEVLLGGACGLRAVGLSLDDLYLTRAERAALAREVHPLLATRGVPGTHDVDLGMRILGQLRSLGPDERAEVPRFDKATDDRCSAWDSVCGPVDVVLFEGWCVGAHPGPSDRLSAPLNELERDQDPDGSWRRYVDRALGGPYAALFATLDLQVLLCAPDWDSVRTWRKLQEARLRDAVGQPARVMAPAQVDRFVMLFERVTRDVLAEMPERADAVLYLNRAHEIVRRTLRDNPA